MVGAIKVITDHFAPVEHKDSAFLRFRKMKQIFGETIDSFVNRLRLEAKNNSFTNAEVLKIYYKYLNLHLFIYNKESHGVIFYS